MINVIKLARIVLSLKDVFTNKLTISYTDQAGLYEILAIRKVGVDVFDQFAYYIAGNKHPDPYLPKGLTDIPPIKAIDALVFVQLCNFFNLTKEEALLIIKVYSAYSNTDRSTLSDIMNSYKNCYHDDSFEVDPNQFKRGVEDSDLLSQYHNELLDYYKNNKETMDKHIKEFKEDLDKCTLEFNKKTNKPNKHEPFNFAGELNMSQQPNFAFGQKPFIQDKGFAHEPTGMGRLQREQNAINMQANKSTQFKATLADVLDNELDKYISIEFNSNLCYQASPYQTNYYRYLFTSAAVYNWENNNLYPQYNHCNFHNQSIPFQLKGSSKLSTFTIVDSEVGNLSEGEFIIDGFITKREYRGSFPSNYEIQFVSITFNKQTSDKINTLNKTNLQSDKPVDSNVVIKVPEFILNRIVDKINMGALNGLSPEIVLRTNTDCFKTVAKSVDQYLNSADQYLKNDN